MKRILAALGLGLGLATAAPLPAAAALTQLSDLFVFGDSLSDAGNSGILTNDKAGVVYPPFPYFNGQFSNGPVAVQYLWDLFNPGNPGALKPSLAGGTDYAIGGATTGSANFNSVSASAGPLQPVFAGYGNDWQVEQFLSRKPSFDPATSLFVVWLFPNDVFANYGPAPLWPGPGSSPNPGNTVDATLLIGNGITNIVNTITTLALTGAQHFLVPNMPDLGKIPEYLNDQGTSALLSALTAGFNSGLSDALTSLDKQLLAEIVQFDTPKAFAKITANPSAFGFDNVTESCVANIDPFDFFAGKCNPTNWDRWMFWDGVHPTTATHRLLAQEFAAAVPEPGTVTLVTVAMLLVVTRRRTTHREASVLRSAGG